MGWELSPFITAHSELLFIITIDGLQEIHDGKKPLANGQGTFGVVVNNLKQIKENVKSGIFSFVIRSNVTADALAGMDDFTGYFYWFSGNNSRALAGNSIGVSRSISTNVRKTGPEHRSRSSLD